MDLEGRVARAVGAGAVDDAQPQGDGEGSEEGSDSWGIEGACEGDEEEEEVVEVEESELLRLMDAQEDAHVVCCRLLRPVEEVSDAMGQDVCRALLHSGVFVRDGFVPADVAAALYREALEEHSRGGMRVAGQFNADDPHRAFTSRGDHITFLREGQGVAAHPAVATALRAMLDLGGCLRGFSNITLRRPEVQLAVYPAGGTHYERHRDALPSDESWSQHDRENGMAGGEQEEEGEHEDRGWGYAQRKLTTILYANPEWKEADGGRLRVFLRGEGAQQAKREHAEGGKEERKPNGEGNAVGVNEQGEVFEDVAPIAGRLVVFLSGCVDHSVLPSDAPRVAITIWWR